MSCLTKQHVAIEKKMCEHNVCKQQPHIRARCRRVDISIAREVRRRTHTCHSRLVYSKVQVADACLCQHSLSCITFKPTFGAGAAWLESGCFPRWCLLKSKLTCRRSLPLRDRAPSNSWILYKTDSAHDIICNIPCRLPDLRLAVICRIKCTNAQAA